MRSSSPRPRGFLGPSSTVTARETLAKRGWWAGARPRLDVRLFLDITQGMGLAGAAGVRPFLPALLSGALARADLGLDFEHTRYAFLESTWFLVAVVVLLIITVVIERRRPGSAETGASAPPWAASPSAWVRCCSPARGRPRRDLVGVAGARPRVRVPRPGGGAVPVRSRGQAPGRRGARWRCRSTPTAARWPRPPWRSSSRRCRSSSSASWPGCGSAAAGARARSTQACAR